MLKRLIPLPILLLNCVWALPVYSQTNILYLNSTRGSGTGTYGSYRSAIADSLDNYQDGSIFDVDFVQTHVPGNLATFLNTKPIDYYDQIWFDTTILNTSYVLNSNDFTALNTWAASSQPEFILDSSFFARNHTSGVASDSAAAVTINQALALQEAGGGIFIGTDDGYFVNTANQILWNFGFDSFFAGVANITSNGSFVGDLLLEPESVGADFFTNHLQGLSTSHVPIGTHVLNENGGNRTIEIYENLYSLSPGHISHIGASFNTGDFTTPIDDPTTVPEPGSVLGLLFVGIFGTSRLRKQR